MKLRTKLHHVKDKFSYDHLFRMRLTTQFKKQTATLLRKLKCYSTKTVKFRKKEPNASNFKRVLAKVGMFKIVLRIIARLWKSFQRRKNLITILAKQLKRKNFQKEAVQK